MRLARVSNYVAGILAGFGYFSNEDILLILSILIMVLQMLYDHLTERRVLARIDEMELRIKD